LDFPIQDLACWLEQAGTGRHFKWLLDQPNWDGVIFPWIFFSVYFHIRVGHKNTDMFWKDEVKQ
jgi:hypothetical protein